MQSSTLRAGVVCEILLLFASTHTNNLQQCIINLYNKNKTHVNLPQHCQ